MTKNISDQLVEILTHLGVKQIFGIPGDTIDSLMESLRIQKEIEFIILRHEETGAFAASAQAKLTGNLGVCVACQGPGAIHLLNGLYDAALDRVPVLAITGQIDSSLIGTGMPQEINQMALFNEVCVFNQEIRSAENFPRILTLACRTALNQRGVAHISIPADIMRAAITEKYIGENIVVFNSRLMPSEKELNEAAALLNAAKKVSILYGGGSRGAEKELIELSHLLKAPLIHTTRSKDILDNHLDNYVGGIGLMGVRSANHAATECDVYLIVGSSFAFREFYPTKAKIIQIDQHAFRLGAHVPIALGLWGDSQWSLSELLPKIKQKEDDTFLKEAQSMKESVIKHKKFFARATKEGDYIHPQALTEHIGALADDNAIFCVGSGSVTVYCNTYLRLNGKQRFLWSWNLATLGWALPAALGCKLIARDRQVIVPVGDGDFHMLIADFITFVKYELPVIFIVYNNSCYRFIELEETGEGNPAFGTKFLNPDYAKLAEAHGALGITVRNYSDMDSALKTAFQSKVPVIVNVYVNPNELFIPPKLTPKMAINFVKSKVKGWGF